MVPTRSGYKIVKKNYKDISGWGGLISRLSLFHLKGQFEKKFKKSY